MKRRGIGLTFAINRGDAKSQFKNSLDELLAFKVNYGVDILLLKLVLSFNALGLTQNLGIDYRAATQELYYYITKHDPGTYAATMTLANSVLERSRQI